MSDALVTETALHGGRHLVIRHDSTTTNTRMELSVFIPPQAKTGGRLPCLFYLSGLTCTWENAATKAGAQAFAAKSRLKMGVAWIIIGARRRADAIMTIEPALIGAQLDLIRHAVHGHDIGPLGPKRRHPGIAALQPAQTV